MSRQVTRVRGGRRGCYHVGQIHEGVPILCSPTLNSSTYGRVSKWLVLFVGPGLTVSRRRRPPSCIRTCVAGRSASIGRTARHCEPDAADNLGPIATQTGVREGRFTTTYDTHRMQSGCREVPGATSMAVRGVIATGRRPAFNAQGFDLRFVQPFNRFHGPQQPRSRHHFVIRTCPAL